MNYKMLVFTAVTSGLFFSQILPAEELTPQAKSMMCIGCHGEKGIGNSPLWPNLAGQKSDYLAKQLKAFKDGTRKDPMMNPMVANLTEKDIEDLAQYFSKLSAQ